VRFLLKNFGDEIRQIEVRQWCFSLSVFPSFFFFTKLYCTLKSVEKHYSILCTLARYTVDYMLLNLVK
jgi:hypothetical protein